MARRIPTSTIGIPNVLAEELHFKTSNRTAANRFLKAALTERISSYKRNDPHKCGIPTERLVNLYSKWGHGGFGMIFTGNIVVDYKHLESAGNAIIDQRIESDERKNAFRKIANGIKSQGSLSIAQLSNAGRQTPITINEHPFSASDVQLKVMRRGAGFGVPIPLTEEQIQTEVIERFVYAAKFCKEVGFDGIELHGAHGYLLSQFMSPTTNKRNDRYGGSVENRVRIVLEIYNAIRKEIPANTGFIVGIKMNSVEFQDQGIQIEDSVYMCKEFEIGFDFIELSGGTIEKLAFQHLKESTRAREAFFLQFAQKIKPALTKAVVYLTGGFRTVPSMIKAVQDGATDGIGLGRPATAEPDLPKKILFGQVQSALINPFDDDFAISNTSSNSQMFQAGSSTVEEVKGNLCFGIMDLSDENVANDYKEAVTKYHEHIFKLAQAGNPIAGVFEYGLENVVNNGS